MKLAFLKIVKIDFGSFCVCLSNDWTYRVVQSHFFPVRFHHQTRSSSSLLRPVIIMDVCERDRVRDRFPWGVVRSNLHLARLLANKTLLLFDFTSYYFFWKNSTIFAIFCSLIWKEGRRINAINPLAWIRFDGSLSWIFVMRCKFNKFLFRKQLFCHARKNVLLFAHNAHHGKRSSLAHCQAVKFRSLEFRMDAFDGTRTNLTSKLMAIKRFTNWSNQFFRSPQQRIRSGQWKI